MVDGYFDCSVKLNPDEAIEHDRAVMLGSTLLKEGWISWKEFLTDYMNKSEDEAENTIAEALAEQAILTDPVMRELRTQEAIELMGAERFLKKAQEENEMSGRMDKALKEQPQSAPRPSEASNPAAKETLRQAMEPLIGPSQRK